MFNVFNLVICIIICTVFIDKNYAKLDEDSNNWIQPDAWGLAETVSDKLKTTINQKDYHKIEDTQNCPDDRIKFTEQTYLKLIRYIFRKTYMRKIPDSNQYLRSIDFYISYEQFERLDNAEDIRDIDSIVSDIISQSRMNDKTYQLLNWSDEILIYTKEFIELIKSFHHLVIALLALSVIVIIKLKTQIRISLLLLILLLMFFIWRVKIEYDICLKKIETEDYLKFIQNKNIDHCKKINEETNNGVFNYINKIFGLDSHSKCVQQIMEQTNGSKKCMLSKIVATASVQLFFEPAGVIIDETLTLTLNIVDKFKFPYNYIFAAVILFSFFFLIKDLLRTTITSFIQNFFQTRNSNNHPIDQVGNNQQAIEFAAGVITSILNDINNHPITTVSSQGESIDEIPTSQHVRKIKNVPESITEESTKKEKVEYDKGDDIVSISENHIDLK